MSAPTPAVAQVRISYFWRMTHRAAVDGGPQTNETWSEVRPPGLFGSTNFRNLANIKLPHHTINVHKFMFLQLEAAGYPPGSGAARGLRCRFFKPECAPNRFQISSEPIIPWFGDCGAIRSRIMLHGMHGGFKKKSLVPMFTLIVH